MQKKKIKRTEKETSQHKNSMETEPETQMAKPKPFWLFQENQRIPTHPFFQVWVEGCINDKTLFGPLLSDGRQVSNTETTSQQNSNCSSPSEYIAQPPKMYIPIKFLLQICGIFWFTTLYFSKKRLLIWKTDGNTVCRHSSMSCKCTQLATDFCKGHTWTYLN